MHVKSFGVAPGYWQMPDPCTAQICYAVAGRVGGGGGEGEEWVQLEFTDTLVGS